MGAESADFFFDCWYLKVIMDDGIEHIGVCRRVDFVSRETESTFIQQENHFD
jgi:hypothetical protein